jgi:hypothetical protein
VRTVFRRIFRRNTVLIIGGRRPGAYPPAGAKKGTSAKIKNGKFKVVLEGSPDVEDDKRTVSGTFNGKKVSGKIKVEGLCRRRKQYSAKR